MYIALSDVSIHALREAHARGRHSGSALQRSLVRTFMSQHAAIEIGIAPDPENIFGRKLHLVPAIQRN